MTRRGDSVSWERRTTFLCYEKLGEFSVKLSTCFWSRRFSVMTWLLLAIEVQFCNFQRGGLEDFTVNVQFLWLVQNHLYHFERLIGSVPIGEGPWDVAQWRGWTPLSTSVCDSGSVFSAWHLFISLIFHSCSKHLIYVNVVPLINLLHAFSYNKLLKH